MATFFIIKNGWRVIAKYGWNLFPCLRICRLWKFGSSLENFSMVLRFPYIRILRIRQIVEFHNSIVFHLFWIFFHFILLNLKKKSRGEGQRFGFYFMIFKWIFDSFQIYFLRITYEYNQQQNFKICTKKSNSSNVLLYVRVKWIIWWRRVS